MFRGLHHDQLASHAEPDTPAISDLRNVSVVHPDATVSFRTFIGRLTQMRPRNLSGKIRLWIVQLLLPVLYSTVQYAPDILLSPEMLRRGGR